jgi:sortase (surface protein transpeptidase)
LPDEVATWARDRGERSTCTDVPTPSGDYLGVTGRDVVLPTQTDVLDTVPRHPTVNPEQPERLLTITTCHPRFSARQRLVIHAVLTAATAKPSRSP